MSEATCGMKAPDFATLNPGYGPHEKALSLVGWAKARNAPSPPRTSAECNADGGLASLSPPYGAVIVRVGAVARKSEATCGMKALDFAALNPGYGLSTFAG